MNVLNFICSLFKPTPVSKLAERELYRAKRSLLDSQHNRDYFTKQCEFHQIRIKQLTDMLNNGSAD